MWNKPALLNAIADLLILIGAAAIVAVGAVWMVRMPSLPVRQVVFAEPLSHTRRIEVEQVLPAALRGNFFSVNLDLVRGTLEKLPWVRRVAVRRVWPARLEVSVEEHKPVARWGEGRGELVNSHAEVFSAALPEALAEQLPLLYGPQGTAPEVLKRYSEFVSAFRPIGEKPVQLVLSPRLAWRTRLANGMQVELGREQQKAPVSLRLARFVDIYPELIASRPSRPAVVDLRYPNGFAVRMAAAEAKGK